MCDVNSEPVWNYEIVKLVQKILQSILEPWRGDKRMELEEGLDRNSDPLCERKHSRQNHANIIR